MCRAILHPLILMTLACLSHTENGTEAAETCLEHQKAFRGSCFEFVGLRLSFVSAQSWCEKSGGHLAFIPDEDTQDFLERHLDFDQDLWLGLARSFSSKRWANEEGALSWLDGSPVTYSKCMNYPHPNTACGHILKNSGFHWGATGDCSKELQFICQFEFGRSIVCAGRNTTLLCGAGQVLMIDSCFYGRDSVHYCRSSLSPSASTQHECGWVDVADAIAAHCNGRQSCEISAVMTSFHDLCPQLLSYLSVDYHCKDGLTLSMDTTAAVFEDVTIGVKWFLKLSEGKLQCKLNTGDGCVVYLNSTDRSESSVVHKYTHPNTYVVAVECANSEMHSTAHKIITIQQPVTETGAIRCYAGNRSFYEPNCKALYGEAFQIQLEVKAGINVSYRIQSNEKLLSGLSVVRGNVPQNITLTPDVVKELGPGCHHLSLYASNAVTVPEISKDLQVCILEKISGLQAFMISETDDCLDITLGVSLDHGAPVLLFFSLNEDTSSFFETREMNTKKGTFHIKHLVQGSERSSATVKLTAQNAFSSLAVDVDVFPSCIKDPDMKQNSLGDHLLRVKRTEEKHIRVPRSSLEITATPEQVSTKNTAITLKVDDFDTSDTDVRYEWECKNPCKCQGKFNQLTHTIQSNCLPDPFEFNKYHFNVIEKSNNKVKETESICIALIPDTEMPATLSCTEGCNPIKKDTNAKINMICPEGQSCQGVVWYIENPESDNKWEDETQSCYKEEKRRPLIQKQNGGTEYTVTYNYLALAKGQGLTVVITSGDTTPLYKKFTIDTKSSEDPASTTKSPDATATTKNPSTIGTTTTTDGDPNPTTRSTPGATSATPTAPAATRSSATTSSPASSSSAATTAVTTAAATTSNPDGLSCSILPPSGTVLDAFSITCNIGKPCTKWKHLRCSKNNVVNSIFLPLGNSSANYNLIITATAKDGSFATNTRITVQVKDSTVGSVDGLTAAVENTVAQLKEQGLLSGETMGQLFCSVADKLNGQSDQSKKAERQKLRDTMMDIMVDMVKEIPFTVPEEVQMMARGLSALVQKEDELNTSAQEKASSLFQNMSSSLLHMDLTNTEDNKKEIHTTASVIVGGVSNIMDHSSYKNVSDALLVTLNNAQSALLMFMEVNEGPTTIKEANIGLLVNRMMQKDLNVESVNIPNSSCPAFSLPALPSNIFPSGEPVDVRMLSLDKNPFSWNERGNINSLIGALSLTTKDGSTIPVENLSEDIEILLPRPAGEQVNTTVLDLGNYSTTIIDIHSADTTLLLKMVPSKDPLPFKVLLGYMGYPTETNYVAMTQMPLQGTTQGERYTWILKPEDLKGNTGIHFLVVRPIVGPGIKSINASLSITPITTSCKFWDESLSDWSSKGCRVGLNSTHLVTQCLCKHLSFFGSSFFVTPNLVDPSRTAELFATFAENPVVVCFVGALFVTYLLVVVWARRKDIQDTAKVKVTLLEDNNPMDEYRYLLSVSTGHRIGASTSSQVTVTLLGEEGNSEPHHLTDPQKPMFERGAVDLFLITTPFSLGDLQGIRLWHNNSGSHPAWYVSNVMVQDLQTERKWHFLCNSWLAIDVGDCCIDTVFPVASEGELKKFSNLFFMKTTKDFSDGHLWFSVINRPRSSTFTCVQRVSCCFSLLLCTMLTSVMFYGIPKDPSEQTMDLGHFKFTWQQFMVGVQSSLIMFPVNILIVSIFRNTRPREATCCRQKTKKTNILEQESTLQTVSSQTANMNVNATLDVIIKDITGITHSLSKTVKSNIPCTESEFGPRQHNDINAVLSVVEDFIRQSHKTSDSSQAKTQLAESSAASSVEGIQKKSNETKYLYRQLCHIDKELTLLGPSSFPTPHSYSQALQQIQGMKVLLEDQLYTSSSFNLDEPMLNKDKSHRSIPADSTDGEGSQKKSVCCHGGLPWWFIFVGWLLVITTSVISGFFTMLYGLKFGKERSVSWLVSMIVSFFQSLLFIQPLKVLFLAVFFALLIKKVDEEDWQNMAFVTNTGDCKGQTRVRRGGLYHPPPPANIERMRRNKIMEEKASALIREILAYVGFMWMLLLVAYGQRDPNAYLLNQHIKDSFTGDIADSMSLGDIFTWANTSLLSNLYGVYPGFITDGNSKLVGNARLRQLRVHKNSCQIADALLNLVPDCHAPYSWEVEDMVSYQPGWNSSVRDDNSSSTPSPWRYQTQAELRAHPVWGKMVIYRGGGFVAELGPNFQNSSSTLGYLFRNKWLDVYTRAVFVEFTVYNANVNLFCIVTLLLESTAVGAFQLHSELQSIRLYQSTGGLHIFVMASEIIYMLFILYYMFQQGKLMKQQRWIYFKNKWNLLELTIIILSWSAVAVFTKRTLLGNRDITYYQNHKDHFPSFYETAIADATLQYLIAFLVLLSTVKLWHLLRLNPKTNMITAALQRAWNDIASFLVIIVIMFLAYSITSNVIYGWKMSSYKTIADALLTIICLQIGIFNYDEILDNTPVLGGLLFGSCIVFMTFVVLNLLLSVILVAFNQEHINHKPSEEEEIVDLMLKKICGLFGIRYKDTKESDVNDSGALALNNSRNIQHTPSNDVNGFQTCDSKHVQT
ncbi:polycystic kidney disease protein 1-like 2 [Parambassis ranga]|uniref:Polycystic kidney disease protein 1-like 2 n=1 Tax=Parambassis ranga TaxID=210632 RepID=A0A6P7KJ00_9TELE|nr:polycystic kidney disease protein 1-like 2 [Parambassis ranga]